MNLRIRNERNHWFEQFESVYARMPEEDRAAFGQMTQDAQAAYMRFWLTIRPDNHAAHRDTLPAFQSGWDACAQSVREVLADKRARLTKVRKSA